LLQSGISLLILIFLMLAGAPIGFAFAVAVLFMIVALGYDPQFLLPYSFDRMSTLVLLAIPLFIIAGGLMEKGNLTRHLILFVNSLASRIRGGLGATTAVASAIFGAISGSAGAAICCIGAIMIPRLVEEEGYPRGYATSLATASAGLALLIPPSLTMILYGWVTGTSVTACFLAGAFPGLFLMLLFIIINWVMVGKYRTVRKPRAWENLGKVSKDVFSTGWRAFPALIMPLLILGSIYGGVATPTEAAAISVIYAIPVGFFIYRGLTLKNFANSLVESSITIGSIMVMLFFSMMLSRMLVEENIPDLVASFLLSVTQNKYLILLMVNFILFLVGMFMDDTSGIIIASPLLLPVIKAIGLSPVHFAAIICTNLTMGNLTPPMAPLVFIGQRIGKVAFADMIKTSMMFVIFGYLPAVLITTYFAPMGEWLPRVVLGERVLLSGA
jgi:C4-dicarboxylate transporter DctM subunit